MLAYLGAFIFTAAGCLYEVFEAISHDIGEVEPFAQITCEIVAATVAGAAFFAAASVIRNWLLTFSRFRPRRLA
jgi:hypothetical protein